MWIFMTVSAMLVFALSCILAILCGKRRQRKGIIPLQVLLVGTFISDFLIFFPPYYDSFTAGNGIISSVFLALHDTIQLFTVNNDFSLISEISGFTSPVWHNAYVAFSAFLYIFTPLLTFGFLLSFVRNFSDYVRFLCKYTKDVYVFSELNERSFELAQSAYAEDTHKVTVFFESEKADKELHYRAQKLGCICFSGSISFASIKCHGRKSKVTFFLINGDEDKNIDLVTELISFFKQRENIFVYLFSSSAQGELLLNSADVGKIVLRRVDISASLVNGFLYQRGHELFEKDPDADAQQISVAVVGLGAYGSEFSKNLPWFCQMDGYRFNLEIFEKEPSAISRFKASCPELWDEEHNGQSGTGGDAQYKMTAHCMDAESLECYEFIRKAPGFTHIFVACGDDGKNIRISLTLREWLAQKGDSPKIYAVVFDPNVKKQYGGAKNHAGQSFDISFIGGIDELYSTKNILHSELDREALERHMKWGNEEAFWKYEYNYSSSVASAIHLKMKKYCRISGIEKDKSERSEEERWNIRRLEHRRWNAYMRSRGYRYAPERNDLAKTHPCLVSFELLPVNEQIKDDD